VSDLEMLPPQNCAIALIDSQSVTYEPHMKASRFELLSAVYLILVSDEKNMLASNEYAFEVPRMPFLRESLKRSLYRLPRGSTH